jgi:hypothetical protein
VTALRLIPAAIVLLVASVALAQTPPQAPPLSGSAQIRKIVEDARGAYNKLERPVVIFDLDGALFDQRTRTAQILREYADQELRGVRPDAAQRLLAMSYQNIGYMLTDTLQNAGITESAVANNAAVFWSQRYFTDEYVKYDQPTPGAVDYVRMMYSNGARIIYISSRDVPRQLSGTVRALHERGFPIGIAGTEVILKPTQQTPEAQFKQQVVTYLKQYGKVIGVFETLPANANDYKRVFPDSTVVLLDAPRAPNQPAVNPGVVQVSGFN